MEIRIKNLVYDHKALNNMRNHPLFSMKHSHNNYEIIFFEHGEANYVVESRRYKLHNNDLILTKPCAYHFIEIQSNAEYSRYHITCDPSFVGQILDAIDPDIEVVHCDSDSIIAANFRKMDYYGARLCETDFFDILSCLLKEIFYNISLGTADIAHDSSELSPSITRTLDYINENLLQIKSIKEICEHLHLSESYFFKLFNEQLKISPLKYINLKRLQHAQKRIQSGKKPSEIYSECGFDSYVGFYKQYRKIFGYPPSQEISI